MKVYCKTYGLALANEIRHYDGNSFGEAEGQNYIQPGFYVISDGECFSGSKDAFFISPVDLINGDYHPDRSRLNGCCGLDGCGGPNKVCLKGHEIATEKSDCWMPHAEIFEKNQTILK